MVERLALSISSTIPFVYPTLTGCFPDSDWFCSEKIHLPRFSLEGRGTKSCNGLGVNKPPTKRWLGDKCPPSFFHCNHRWPGYIVFSTGIKVKLNAIYRFSLVLSASKTGTRRPIRQYHRRKRDTASGVVALHEDMRAISGDQNCFFAKCNTAQVVS